MDKGQILRDYRAAKNHKRQISILADLNTCSKEAIIEILTEGGYLRIFNTNGVDISTKTDEIKEQYKNGVGVAALAKTYHVSQKNMKILLGIEETEEETMANEAALQKRIDVLTDENRELRDRLNEAADRINALKHELDKAQTKELSDVEVCERYQDLCIKNNQLNATIDVLIEKISVLKAVRGNE